ncbi:hypothetical protein L2E82_01601 [Cichorium intybus]|uniref:Uncharacterized protein n=1 Tax=Cichorium intybus TaxID=13427 RepID=A0ACB9H0G3_CICIN|nr:hypothetical protein L2E82_01601 [Cichorium intybus]
MYIPLKNYWSNLRLYTFNLHGVKSNISDFRIRLTFEHVDATSAENKTGKTLDNKRIKSDESNGLVKCTNGTMQSGNVSDINSPLRKVGQPCHMTLVCSRAPIFIGGRYLKGEASVEELIGGNILPMCNGDGYKFHAAGREDIDVRMLGSGMPYLVEIQNSRNVPYEVSIKEMENKINSLESNLAVTVREKTMKMMWRLGF